MYFSFKASEKPSSDVSRIHNIDTKDEVAFQESHESEVLSVDVASVAKGLPKEYVGTLFNYPLEGYIIASSGRDRLIHVYQFKEPKLKTVQTLDNHSSSVTCVSFHDEGNALSSCGADKSVIFRGKKEVIPFHHKVLS
jgi:WD40 repeat protein